MGWEVVGPHYGHYRRFVIFYLTFNDAPSGIFKSQVIDVAALLETLSGETVKVVAFVSARNFKASSKWILENRPDSWVVPMVPGIDNWEKNSGTLRWMLRHDSRPKIIARGPLACNLALRTFENARIMYDGRGAVAAEEEEYNVFGNSKVGKIIAEIEKHAVRDSRSQIAVSHALVDYWTNRFAFVSEHTTIIPCSLSDDFLTMQDGQSVREKWGFSDQDVVLAFSGSLSGWHSFDSLQQRLHKALLSQPNLAVVFFSKEHPAIEELQHQHPGRVRREWLKHEDVPAALSACDYGLLIRDKNMTNKVSSPVKFAEYLSCGLPVIISEEIGDFSNFVRVNNCGHILDESNDFPALVRLSAVQKEDIRKIGLLHFSKASENVRNAYRNVLNELKFTRK